MTKPFEITSDPSINPFVSAVLGKKARQVVILDVHKLTSVADTFIICSAHSNRQATAIADFISTYLKKKGKKVLNIEGKKEGHWVLMDYGDVIIHIFFEPLRSFYDLEGLWNDAGRIKTKELVEYEEKETQDLI